MMFLKTVYDSANKKWEDYIKSLPEPQKTLAIEMKRLSEIPEIKQTVDNYVKDILLHGEGNITEPDWKNLLSKYIITKTPI